jgi:hypothetical protein
MKTLVAIALAIAHCRPSLPKAEVAVYAKIVDDRSRALGVDQVLIVALVDHESRWFAGAINKKSGALGLGQILPQFRPACAVSSSAACSAEKSRMLDGTYNLSAVFDAIGAWQRECKKKTGKAGILEWMSAYAGLNRPKMGDWCGWRVSTGGGPPKQLPTHSLVKEILDRQKALRLWLASHPQG